MTSNNFKMTLKKHWHPVWMKILFGQNRNSCVLQTKEINEDIKVFPSPLLTISLFFFLFHSPLISFHSFLALPFFFCAYLLSCIPSFTSQKHFTFPSLFFLLCCHSPFLFLCFHKAVGYFDGLGLGMPTWTSLH